MIERIGDNSVADNSNGEAVIYRGCQFRIARLRRRQIRYTESSE